MDQDGYAKTGYDGEAHALILDQVGVAVITIDSEGSILGSNLSATKMFGYSTSAMDGQNVSMLMPRHHAVQHDNYLKHHLGTGEHRIIGKGRRVEGRRADGTEFPMHLAVGRFEIAGTIYFKGIVHDLSAQDHVQGQATRLGRIVEESINEIFVFAVDTLKFTLANRGALKNLGFTLNEFTQMTPVDIKPLYDENAFRELLAPLISGELERLELQTVHRRKDGSDYDVDVVLHLSEAVSPPEFVAIAQDSTERNAMFKAVSQAQKMESIGELTGGIAHDFNNLLTIISGNLELLDMTLSDPDELELVAEALSASARGADLTHRLLSFARRSSLLPKRLNLNEVVLELSDLLKRSLSEAVSMELRLATDLWNVKVDRSQIDSALMNLVINARDAMSGKGTLIVSTENQVVSATGAESLNLASGNYAVLCVSDTGTGIAADQLQRVFEPFVTTKSKSRGHGLGLSMVYGFAKQSGGIVTVESTVGQGACFSVYLPRDWSPESQPKNSVPAILVKPERHGTILLVEDNDSVRRLTVRRLEHMGHTVLQACDTRAALELWKDEQSFDVLITDMVMPGDIDGLSLAKRIHAAHPHKPVVLSSGFSEHLLALSDQERNEFLILNKPYSMTKLESIVSAALADGDRRNLDA